MPKAQAVRRLLGLRVGVLVPLEPGVAAAGAKEGGRSLQGFRRRKDRFLSERLGRLDAADQATLARAVDILDRLAEDPS